MKINVSTGNSGPGWGSPTTAASVDDFGTASRFNDPRSCTVFGDKLAVGQFGVGENSIRLIHVMSGEVTTLIDEGGGSFIDGEIIPGTAEGGGIGSPNFLHAANSTHLIVCSNIAQVRLIDTVTSEISTLIDSTMRVRSK